MLSTYGTTAPAPAGETPVLARVDGPGALRDLGPDDLARLADEMRNTLVRTISRTGGHLGSNLGAVEVTLAVHRAFRSPYDVVLWDTGHAAYPHKLVTGRREAFATLRRAGGMSGYPSRRESPHDWVENSHASTALSYADGLARAFDLQDEDRRVVVVVGDGALTGGMAYEALNNIGFYGSRVTIIVNDNGRSYAPTVSPLTVGEHGHGRRGARPFFEALGFAYAGPLDGHDVGVVEDALCRAQDAPGPTVVHAVTEKGRGYPPATAHVESRLHDCAPFPDLAAGPPPRAAAGYTAAFAEALVAAGRRRPEVVAVTAAMPGSAGLLPFRAAFPDRFVDVGIAEQHATTSGAGLAMGGLRPVLAIYSSFFSRAFDQANLDVGLHGLPVTFVLDRAGVTGDDGPSHNGVLDLALCLQVPGMTVFAPSSPPEVAPMLDAALGLDGPAALRFPKGAGPDSGPDDVGHGLRARCVRRGDGSVCVLAVGRMLEPAREAAGLLADAGVEVTMWDPRVVRPPDDDMVADAARHAVVVTVEDGVAQGGAGTFLAAAIGRAAGGEPGPGPGPVVVTRGTPARYLDHGNAADILAALGLDGPGIARTVVRACARAGLDTGTPGAGA